MKTAKFDQMPRLNHAQLEDLLVVDQGRTDLARELWDICTQQAALRFGKMRDALENWNFESIERELHAFKTTCHSTGLARAHLMSHELQLEVSRDTVDPEEVRRGLVDLQKEVESGLDEVGVFIAEKQRLGGMAA